MVRANYGPGCRPARHASQADSVPVPAVVVVQCSATSPPHHSPSLPPHAQLIAEPQHRGEQPWMVVDANLSAIAETCMSMRFPASADGGSSEVTLPFCMLTGHVMADE